LHVAVEELLHGALAAAEVLVDAAVGQLVEARDARLQVGEEVLARGGAARRVRDALEARADRAGELLQRLAADDVRVARPRVADDEPPVLVARAVTLAALVPDLDEDEMRVLAGERVPAEERLRE